jgi:formate-dependent nitrite reductase membrane component NrfD
MGALFLVSAASTSYALLLLLLRRTRASRATTLEKLTRADQWAIVIELVVIALTLALLGGLARPFIWGGFGVVFWLGVVGVGLVLPLVLHAREHGVGGHAAGIASACVLVGGLLLRFVLVMSPQWPRVPLFYL